jgi:hypothetical protein
VTDAAPMTAAAVTATRRATDLNTAAPVAASPVAAAPLVAAPVAAPAVEPPRLRAAAAQASAPMAVATAAVSAWLMFPRRFRCSTGCCARGLLLP